MTEHAWLLGRLTIMRGSVIAVLIVLPAAPYATANPERRAMDSQADCVWLSGCDSDIPCCLGGVYLE
jgi:hypothetical protein